MTVAEALDIVRTAAESAALNKKSHIMVEQAIALIADKLKEKQEGQEQ